MGVDYENDHRHTWQLDEKLDEFDGKERADYGPGMITLLGGQKYKLKNTNFRKIVSSYIRKSLKKAALVALDLPLLKH